MKFLIDMPLSPKLAYWLNQQLINMETVEICEFCDGKVEHRVIQARFHFKGQTIYIDGVPAWVCNKCNEHYFDADVYKKLEDIARHKICELEL